MIYHGQGTHSGRQLSGDRSMKQLLAHFSADQEAESREWWDSILSFSPFLFSSGSQPVGVVLPTFKENLQFNFFL